MENKLNKILRCKKKEKLNKAWRKKEANIWEVH